jgi:REP element-mobilizing transposase RayT
MPWTIPAKIPLPRDFIGFDPTSCIPQDDFSAYSRHLPHWRLPGACYFVTFRLEDSIPKPVLDGLNREADQWKLEFAKHGGNLPPQVAAAWHEFERVRLRKLESVLDECHGKCLLRDPGHRQVVINALHHFEGERCEMLAYAVMPNHVHALCRPLLEHRLEELCGSWKWFTSQKIQRSLGRTGALWQDESFDRIIRDEDHYATAMRYIAKNPIKAKLTEHESSVWFCEQIRVANAPT